MQINQKIYEKIIEKIIIELSLRHLYQPFISLKHIIFMCCLYHLYLAVVFLIVQYDCFSFLYFFIYTFLKSGRWFVDDIITVFKMLNLISDFYYFSFFIIINCSFYIISRLLGFCNYFLNQFLISHFS